MLDVGTGSGAVALALKDERPDLVLAGSDASEDALALAEANGRRLGLEVRWLHADLLAGVAGRVRRGPRQPALRRRVRAAAARPGDPAP